MNTSAHLRGATATVLVHTPGAAAWHAVLSVLGIGTTAIGEPVSYRGLSGKVHDVVELDGLVVGLRDERRAHLVSVHLIPLAAACELTIDAEPDHAHTTVDWNLFRHRSDYRRTRRLVRTLAAEIAERAQR